MKFAIRSDLDFQQKLVIVVALLYMVAGLGVVVMQGESVSRAVFWLIARSSLCISCRRQDAQRPNKSIRRME
jgi:hypothetical protein